MRRRGVGWAEVEVGKQISPLRCSQKARAASVEMTMSSMFGKTCEVSRFGGEDDFPEWEGTVQQRNPAG